MWPLIRKLPVTKQRSQEKHREVNGHYGRQRPYNPYHEKQNQKQKQQRESRDRPRPADIAGGELNARTNVRRYNANGKTQSSGTAATSVEINVVTAEHQAGGRERQR